MVGRIVYSKCGHDKNNVYVVVEADDSFCYLADGKYKLLAKPKKKNLKHVQFTNYICDEIRHKLYNKNCHDDDVRKAIKIYLLGA